VLRGEIARSLLDLLGASLTARLVGFRELAARAAELVKELDVGTRRSGGAGPREPSPKPGANAKSRSREASPAGEAGESGEIAPAGEEPAEARAVARVPAAERRAAAIALIAIWRDVLRDLAAVVLGERRLVRDVDILDDLEAAAAGLPPDAVAAALRRLDVAGERLEGNVSPELVLDVLALQHGR
jgi:hypothetical protein